MRSNTEPHEACGLKEKKDINFENQSCDSVMHELSSLKTVTTKESFYSFLPPPPFFKSDNQEPAREMAQQLRVPDANLDGQQLMHKTHTLDEAK